MKFKNLLKFSKISWHHLLNFMRNQLKTRKLSKKRSKLVLYLSKDCLNSNSKFKWHLQWKKAVRRFKWKDINSIPLRWTILPWCTHNTTTLKLLPTIWWINSKCNKITSQPIHLWDKKLLIKLSSPLHRLTLNPKLNSSLHHSNRFKLIKKSWVTHQLIWTNKLNNSIRLLTKNGSLQSQVETRKIRRVRRSIHTRKSLKSCILMMHTQMMKLMLMMKTKPVKMKS